ncbi:MAG TPA: hypothetical protein VM600_10550 [Actinomycetota bacterium]|nr:hypothetical protein [Actinomycetota bacterium]
MRKLSSFLIAIALSLVLPASAGATEVTDERHAADSTLLPAAGPDEDPDVAAGPAGSLVAWTSDPGETNYDVVAIRLDRAGRRIDSRPIELAATAEDDADAAVVWTGTQYMAAWRSIRNGTWDILARTVAIDGSLGAITVVSEGMTQDGPPRLARAGDRVLVAFPRDNAATYGAILSLDAAVESPPFSILPGGTEVDAGSDGNRFIVVASFSRDGAPANIEGAFVSTTGSAGTPFTISTGSRDEIQPRVTWSHPVFFVAWSDRRNSTGTYDVYGARISAAGSVLDTSGIAIARRDRQQWTPALSTNGSHFVVFYTDQRLPSSAAGIYAARVRMSGAVVDPSGIAVTRARSAAAATASWTGARLQVAWQDARNASTATDIASTQLQPWLARISATDTIVSLGSNRNDEPEVAWNGRFTLAVWADSRGSTGSDIYAARVSPSGRLMDPLPLAVSRAARSQRNPAVAWNGSVFLVTWTDHRGDTTANRERGDIYGARVSASGRVLDPAGLPIRATSGSREGAAVTAIGSSFIVVWSECFDDSAVCNEGERYDLAGARLSSSGAVVKRFAVSRAAGPQRDVSLVTSTTTALAVWRDCRNDEHHCAFAMDDDSRNGDIYAARISSAGSVLDASGIPIAATPLDESQPDVAWSGRSYVVVWRGDLGPESALRAVRVGRDGRIWDPVATEVTQTPGIERDPAVDWTGSSFVVAYVHQPTATPHGDIAAARITSDGHVLETNVPVSTTPAIEDHPSVSRAPDGSAMVVYERVAGSPHRARRAFLRFIRL